MGLRLSRTWQVWLQSRQGRARSGWPARTQGDQAGVGDLGPGHLDQVGVPRPTGPGSAASGSTTLPCRTTGTRAGGRARMARHSSRLVAGGVWASGR